MPYRSYKKRFYKRYGRKSKFTKYNTYKNRGSKAQANQIYSLSKRISSIEKKTKPEYLQHEYYTSLTVPSTGLWRNDRYNVLEMSGDNQMLVQTAGSIHGSAIRMIKLIIWGSITRLPASHSVLQDNPGYLVDNLPYDNPVLVRLLVGLLPRSSTSVPAVTEIFKTDGDYRVDNFKAPLMKGAGQVITIKKFKKYSMILNNQMSKTFKFTVPLYGAICRKVEGNAYPFHTPFIFSSVLNNEYDMEQPIGEVSISLNAKLIYTDA